MANQPEEATWEAGIYQFETNDVVEGGAGGIDNRPLLQLANRTKYLYDTMNALLLPITSGKGWLLFNDIVANIPAGWEEVVEMRGRAPFGLDTVAPLNAIGNAAGSKTKVLTAANLPPHSHKLFGNEQVDGNDGGEDAKVLMNHPDRFAAVKAFDTDSDNFDYSFGSSTLTPSAGNSGNGPGTATAIDILNPYRVVTFIKWVGL